MVSVLDSEHVHQSAALLHRTRVTSRLQRESDKGLIQMKSVKKKGFELTNQNHALRPAVRIMVQR